MNRGVDGFAGMCGGGEVPGEAMEWVELASSSKKTSLCLS